MKLLMLTRGPFTESPTPPCTARMTHFISTRGRRVRGTSDNQNTRVDVFMVHLRCSALWRNLALGSGSKYSKSLLTFPQKRCCSVQTFIIFTSVTLTWEGFLSLREKDSHLYSWQYLFSFREGKVRLSLYHEGEGPHNFYFPLIAFSWPQLFCNLWVSNISHQRDSIFGQFSIVPLLDRRMQMQWLSVWKTFWLDRSVCRLWERINDTEMPEASLGQQLGHRSPSATGRPWL